MPRHHHHVSDVCSFDSSSSEELYTRIPHRRHVRHPSVVSSHHHTHIHEPVHGGPNLAVPVVEVGGRRRAASTNGMPQPIIINNADGRSRSHSRERVRPRSRSRRRIIVDDDDWDEIVERRGRPSRSPSPYHRDDFETRKAFERLRAFEQAKAEEEALHKYKSELEAKLAKEELERIEEEQKQKELAKKAVEDWQRKEDLRKRKEKEEEEERERLVEHRLREELKRLKWSPAEIDAFVKGEDWDKHEHRVSVNEMRIARARPTYIRVNRQYLLPETLDAFELPWGFDPVSFDY